MLIHKERLTGSTASGSLELKTRKFFGHRLAHLQVKPATETSTYDLAFTDPDTDIVYDKDGIQGTLRENLQMPVMGAYTINITNASVDEVYVVIMILEEEP